MRRILFAIAAVIALSVSASAQYANYNLADLRTRTAWKLGQDTASALTKQWTNAELNAWVNDGIVYISRAALCYERDTTYSLDTGVVTYTMPIDFIRVSGVKFRGAGGASEVGQSPYGMVGASTSDIGKEVGYQWGESGEMSRTVTISPIPTIIGDSMVVTYFAYVRTLLDDTSTCYLPRAYQLSVPDYAASQAWDMMREADPYWQKFSERLNYLIQTNTRFTEEPNTRTTAEANP